jgi:hypothetical protein
MTPTMLTSDSHLGAWSFLVAQTEPTADQDETAPQQEGATEQKEPSPEEPRKPKGRSIFTHILLYIPNRVVDVFDIVRAGVSVGPGIGVDLTATQYLNVSLLAKTSVGLGFQTFRHLPAEAAATTAVGIGPFKADPEAGLAWHRSPGDIRVELHALLVGAHACVEPFEIFDLIVGFLFFDPVGDDF